MAAPHQLVRLILVACLLVAGLSGWAAEQTDRFGPVGGGEARAELAERLRGIDTYAARFTQAIAGNRGQLLEESTGEVLLQRPMFRWTVETPYPQVIVSAGDVLKVYDPDLEQLTLRPLDDALQDTPISLLTRDDVVLGEDYAVFRRDADGLATYVVAPRSGSTLFAEIELAFDASELRRLSIVDHLGQHTQIRFRSLAGRVIESGDFELEVPPETDVIGG